MNIRPIYVIENQDWLAPKSNLADQEAYEAIVDLWETVTNEQYDAAMADLKNAGLRDDTTEDEQHG